MSEREHTDDNFDKFIEALLKELAAQNDMPYAMLLAMATPLSSKITPQRHPKDTPKTPK